LNTAKQVNIIIGLLFVGLVGTLFYFLWDSPRAETATDRQEMTNVERGAFLFARYCRACHGLTGQGAAERAGLPGAVLNQDANHPPALAASQVTAKQSRLTDTITCGRIGTQMPPWSASAPAEGGPLNFYQIQQLVTLITSQFAPDGWDKVIEYGNEADAQVPAVFLTQDVSTTDTVIHVNSTGTFAKDTLLRIGLDTPDEPYELMVITNVDKDNKTITVQRGPDAELQNTATGSDALAHKSGDEVYTGPQLPPGTITGSAPAPAVAPCGQASVGTPTPAVSPSPVALASGATITLADNVIQLSGQSNPEMDVTAGSAVSATLTNAGTAVHDFRIAGPDGKFNTDDDIVSSPDQITGGTQGTITFNLPAGTYKYQCDFHPTQMLGTIVVK